MPKKPGDMKQGSPPSLGEITQDFAGSLDQRDPRFKYFWEYDLLPKVTAPQSTGDLGWMQSEPRVKALFGSNRSRKSTICCLLAVTMYTGIIPPCLRGVLSWEKELEAMLTGPMARPRHVRIVVMDYSEHWPMVIEPMLTGPDYGMLPEPWSNFDKASHIFQGPDGSLLDIYSSDPTEKKEHGDPKMRGAHIDLTWVDEINREDLYTESVVRGAAKSDMPWQFLFSYCPQEGFSCWTFEKFFQACYVMKGNQPRRLPAAECHTNIASLHLSMRDNPDISEAEIERQKTLLKPWQWAYRVDGWYSNRAEDPYFDIETLLTWEEEDRTSPGVPVQVLEDEVNSDTGVFIGHMKKMLEKDVMKGAIYDEAEVPIWRVWEWPKDDEKYVLSADCADGNPKSDPQSASVWKCTDKNRPKQVAQVHIVRLKPGALAVQCGCMSYIYGNCLVVPECNNTAGGTFTDRLRNHPNLYRRITIDRETEEQTTKLGWRTDAGSKGPMLETTYTALAHMSRDLTSLGVGEDGEEKFQNWCPFNSRITLQEFISYEEKLVRKPDGTSKIVWAGKRGTRDDCVIDASIGLRVIRHEYGKISACKFPKAVAHSLPNEHHLGQKRDKPPRAFSKWKRRTPLNVLRRNHGRNPHG